MKAWEQSQNYESHLKRLTRIINSSRQHHPTFPSPNNHKQRSRTQPNSSHHLQKKIETLPLVSPQEKKLLGASLSTCLLAGREADVVMANYVLSRRILKAKPMISRSKMEKDFRQHEKYKEMRSKGKQSAETDRSQGRIQMFREYEPRLKKDQVEGQGKWLFTLQITSFKKIAKQVRRMQRVMNLTLHLGKLTFCFKGITQLVSTAQYVFRFKAKEMVPSMQVQISQIMGTQAYEVGLFMIDLNQSFANIRTTIKSKHSDIIKHQIEGVRSPFKDQLIGTIAFTYTIKRQ